MTDSLCFYCTYYHNSTLIDPIVQKAITSAADDLIEDLFHAPTVVEGLGDLQLALPSSLSREMEDHVSPFSTIGDMHQVSRECATI